MDTLYRYGLLWLAFAWYMLTATAQTQPDFHTVSGVVRSEDTGKGIAHISVTVPQEHVSTVTNADGYFVLKTRQMPQRITLSHVGYRTKEVTLDRQTQNLEIMLKPSVVMLTEIIVNSGDAREILKAAVAKIPANFSGNAELFRGFYRETTRKGRRYIYVGEAVIDMYKTAYNRPVAGDRVRIDKARRLLSPNAADTLGAKVQGGPTLPLYVDVAKNIEYIFSDAEMMNYDYSLDTPTAIDDRPQIVIDMRPRLTVNYPLYFGRIFIDRNTLAFTRVELELDMSDKAKATMAMLVRKPVGVRFKPKELRIIADYVTQQGVTRLNYVQSSSVFGCEWKRKLFSSNYRVTAEMVVTDRYPEATPIAGRSSFDSRSSLFDKVELFEDSHFWGKDNIIEPTENLLKAIDKLKHKLQKDRSE